tara:strand:+ start:273 stop:1094 length:822 start_codon:yes stop_codon:yes gene_type:complete
VESSGEPHRRLLHRSIHVHSHLPDSKKVSISTTLIRKGRVFVKTDGGQPVAIGQDAAGTGSIKASRLPDLYNQTEVDAQATTITDAEITALGLGTASKSAVGDFATAAQGTKADDSLQKASNLSDLAAASTARTNLGLGSAATAATSDFATAAQGTLANSATQPGDNISTLANDSGFITSANNLSDLAAAATARTNLGLGTIATQAANGVAITGGTISGTIVTLPTYTVSSAPSASPAGQIIFVSDGNSGAATAAVSDGSNFKIVALGGTITT